MNTNRYELSYDPTQPDNTHRRLSTAAGSNSVRDVPPAWAARLLLWLLLFALRAGVQAQFTYTTNNGQITITGYTGPSGALDIPDTINGLPVTRIGDKAFWSRASITNVTIPDNVTTIGQSAFSYSPNLASVTLGNGVTGLGDGVFSGCTSLTNVTLPNSVTRLGDGAFEHCVSLAHVAIPNSVVRLGDRAFNGCTSLTSITVGNSITEIGRATFGGCKSLTSITIPSRVISIKDYAFSDCPRLRGVSFLGNAPSIDEGSFGFDETNEVTVFYLPGTTGWGATFADRPTALWSLPYPVILSGGPGFGVADNGFGFLISWATNAAVVVEASPALATPIWTPVSTNRLTAGTSQFTDPQWASHPTRLYRLR